MYISMIVHNEESKEAALNSLAQDYKKGKISKAVKNFLPDGITEIYMQLVDGHVDGIKFDLTSNHQTQYMNVDELRRAREHLEKTNSYIKVMCPLAYTERLYYFTIGLLQSNEIEAISIINLPLFDNTHAYHYLTSKNGINHVAVIDDKDIVVREMSDEEIEKIETYKKLKLEVGKM